MLNWPPFVLHKIHRRNYFFQTADFVQKAPKKSVFRMSYTDFVSVSIPLGEIVAIFGNKSAEPFFSTSDFELDKYNAFPL